MTLNLPIFLSFYFDPLLPKLYPTNALSNGNTFNGDKAKTAKLSLHLDGIQKTAKLFSCLTFVICSSYYLCFSGIWLAGNLKTIKVSHFIMTDS